LIPSILDVTSQADTLLLHSYQPTTPLSLSLSLTGVRVVVDPISLSP